MSTGNPIPPRVNVLSLTNNSSVPTAIAYPEFRYATVGTTAGITATKMKTVPPKLLQMKMVLSTQKPKPSIKPKIIS